MPFPMDSDDEYEMVSLSDCSTADLLEMLVSTFPDPDITEILVSRQVVSTTPTIDLIRALRALYANNFNGLPFQ